MMLVIFSVSITSKLADIVVTFFFRKKFPKDVKTYSTGKLNFYD